MTDRLNHWLAAYLTNWLIVCLSEWLSDCRIEGQKDVQMKQTQWRTNEWIYRLKDWLTDEPVGEREEGRTDRRMEGRVDDLPAYLSDRPNKFNVDDGDIYTNLRSVKISKCSQFPWWQYRYGYPSLTFRSSNTTSSMRLLVNKPSPEHFLLWGSLAQSMITLIT